MFTIALDELPVLTFRAIVLITAIARADGHPAGCAATLRRAQGKWPALIAASAMNLFVWNIATSLAVLYIPSGHASVLAYTMPLWVALIGFAVFGQRARPAACWLAIAIGAAAVVALMIAQLRELRAARRPVSSGACSRASAGRSAPSSSSARAGPAWACRSPSGRSRSACRRSLLGALRDRRPADALAVGQGAGRHDLHRRRSDGAGHRRLVRPGEAPARPGRRHCRPSPSRSWPS